MNMVTLLLAKQAGQLVGGQFYFHFNGRVSMEFEAWDRNRRELAPNHFLIWEAIKRFHAEGYQIFDFGRTSEENVPLMDFKRRWGTKVVDLTEFHYPVESAAASELREDSPSYRLVHVLCSRAPGFFALELIGRFCYRHLG
jgi:CelD/BcsL family acetyltransferase involved in cellulose biosynthesis